jgi:hypothetical protein
VSLFSRRSQTQKKDKGFLILNSLDRGIGFFPIEDVSNLMEVLVFRSVEFASQKY